MADAPTRLLIVDDSALYRQTIRNVLHDADDVDIVGVAKDGIDAIEKIESLDPDLLTLDVQMPDMDGIGVLREINRRKLRPKAIMVSSLTSEGAQVTTDALLEGAFDFILKPSGSDSDDNRALLRSELDEKICAFRQTAARFRRRSRGALAESAESATEPAPTTVETPPAACRAVVIGTSTGGPAATKEVLPELPATFPVPVLLVQHMPAQYTQSLARRLDEMCPLEVVEAKSGDAVRAGKVYIAPGGRQMKLARRDDRVVVRITDDPHENGCRPAVDYLLRSVASVYDGQALSVIMTGMGRDGVEGSRVLKEHGGSVIAQHEYGCLVYGMPKAVTEEGLADRVLPLGRIATGIQRHVRRRAGTPGD
jgi:two-component system chemotaxis response regulator CheB